MNVLAIVTDRGDQHLPQCLASAAKHLDLDWFDHRFLIDDSGSPNPVEAQGYQTIHHEARRGLGGAVRSAWSAQSDVEFLFHLEEDFVFTQDVDLDHMARLLTRYPYLAQMCLKRNSVNDAEEHVGGFAQLEISQGHEYRHHANWMERRTIFSLNPCLIPGWVFDVTAGGLEAEITDSLCVDPDVQFGIWGTLNDPPAVEHHGHQRSPSWLP